MGKINTTLFQHPALRKNTTAATPAFGIELLPRAIAAWRKEHSETYFAIETRHYDGICDALLDSSIDIGLTFEPGDVPGLSEEVLARAGFSVLAPAEFDFGPVESVSMEDVADKPFIRLDSRGPLGQMLSRKLEYMRQPLNVVAQAETYHVASALAAEGVGVTITDCITAASSNSRGLKAWPLRSDLEFRISALHLGSAPISQLSRRFLDHLTDQIGRFLGIQDP